MKEVNIQEIQKIEDRELRWLVRYEQIVAWHKNGGLRKAAEAYHAQIAEAARAKAVAELRVAQINVIAATVARFDAKAVRNAQISQVAAKYRAEAAERQAIQEACDEVMALEEIVPAADIDEILAQVSSALGIELPTSADRDDICQRGPKSMEDLKRELGTRVPVAEVSPEPGATAVKRPAEFESREAAFQWLIANVDEFDSKAVDWLDRYYPEPDDILDEETLDSAWKAANDPFDAGKSLHELGWKKPYKIEESLLQTLLELHESAVRKLANYRPQSAFHGSSDLYLEGVDALRYAVEDRRKMILDYVLGRDSLDVVKARMAA